MEEPQLQVLHFRSVADFKAGTAEQVAASEVWRVGLSPSDVRWLLGIPEPPRQPPSYDSQLRRCIREGCLFVAGIADGWEVCPQHGVARKSLPPLTSGT